MSPDGSRLAVSDTGTIHVVDTTVPGAEAPAPIALEGNGNVDRVRFLGGDSRLLSSSGPRMALWDLTQVDRLARTATVPIRSGCSACSGPRLALSPDDTRVAVVDGSGSTAAVVDLATGRSSRLPDAALSFVYGAPLWPSGGWAAFPVMPLAGGSEADPPVGLPAGTRSWRAGEGSEQVTTSGVSDDGRTAVIVAQDGKVLLQRLQDGAITRRISVHPELEVGSDVVTAAAVAPAGDRIATLLDDRVSIVDLDSGRTSIRFAAKGATHLAFGGERLFVQKDDGTLEVRRGATLRVERTLPGDPSFGWPPVPNAQGTMVARQRRNGEIALVDVGSGSTLAVLRPDEESSAAKIGIAFSRDGRRLITITDETSYRAGAALVDRDLSTATLIRSVCRTAGSELSAAQWRRFVGVEPPDEATCGP